MFSPPPRLMRQRLALEAASMGSLRVGSWLLEKRAPPRPLVAGAGTRSAFETHGEGARSSATAQPARFDVGWRALAGGTGGLFGGGAPLAPQQARGRLAGREELVDRIHIAGSLAWLPISTNLELTDAVFRALGEEHAELFSQNWLKRGASLFSMGSYAGLVRTART